MRLRIRSAAAEVAAIVNIRDASKKKPPPDQKVAENCRHTESGNTVSPDPIFKIRLSPHLVEGVSHGQT